ncbi:hypothetical protein PHYBOEH_008463 [Phytophthora boehmeriae]|uniref:Protein kinase domain-containing protein n=1 Tax=Phytophthora boehmeriae TaxID=109152 RepID=A0A8T1VZ67_9STRA|nr:hypothetical protein PHYBOEH_008463 [Phytophthora boehmeriae]
MTGHRMQYALLSALVLIFSVKCVDTTDTSTPPGSLSCERVTLGSESATKWTVSCTTTTSSVTAAASFDPSVVENYIVNSGAYVTPTSSYDLNLSSTFSKVDGLVSPTITSFSLSAASGYTPVVPVDISSSAFAKLSVLTTLDIQGIPLADSSLHLVLPSSIQNLSIVDCGLSNLSFEFADGSPIADSSLASIDLRHNALNAIPSALYLLPATISTIDLRGNDEMDLSTETSTQQQQLASWIAKGVLLIDSNPEKRTSVVGALVRTKDVEDATSDPAPPTTLALKLFIEEDADLAGRESYALSSIQHDETTRAFVPQLFDEALEYELEVGTINNAVDVVKLNCCILVLETPSGIALGAHMAASQQPTPPQITRIVAAVQALHTRGLVHGALHTDSFVVCSSNNQLKFWGLEYASRSGHMVPCPDAELLESSKAEYVAPESVSATLDHMSSSRASPALDVWSLGVMILKMFAAGEKLVEFQDCVKPGDIFQLLNETETDSNTCFFELSIAAFVSDEDVKDLLRHCFHWNPLSRPSVDNILMHKAFQVKEREVSRRTRVKSRKISQELSAIVEEQALLEASGNPERKTSTKRLPICEEEEQEQDNQLESGAACDDVAPEPMPPSLWLFLPPTELELDLNEDASFSIEQWVSKLKRLQQQRAEEIRFPLVFMCEVCDSTTAVPCNITTTKFGTSVPSSLLPLVMPLVRETMLFLEARAILSDGLSVGETSGLAGPREWEELRTFYSALEYMELATVNPVNEVMFAPMELQLQSRDPSKAQQVLDELKGLVFSEEKREHLEKMSTGDDEEATSLRHVRPAEEVNPAEQIAAAVLQTDDVTVVGNVEVQSNTEKLKSPRKSLKLPRLSGLSLPENRPSIVNVVVAEVATFHDVFGVLGVPTIVVLVLSAVWTFMLAVIQVHADSMANIMMNTTDFDNGEFWLLPQPDTGLVVSSVVLLSLFGIGYAGLAVMMIFYYRAGSAHKDSSTPSDMSTEAKMVKLSASEKERNSLKRFIAWIRHKLDLPTDVRQHYFTAALDLPKLIFQTITLFTYLRAGFPTAIIYYYSVLLLCNWLMACYRSQRYVADPDLIIARLYYAYAMFFFVASNYLPLVLIKLLRRFDLFFAVFAPLVVLIYFITSFQFDRGAFMTRLETIGPGTFDTVARIFGDPSEISSFCNAFHYLQFSSGSTLFYKSALNVLSLYKWRKIILTLIHNHHERQVERNRKALVEPAVTNLSRSASIRMAITRKIEAVSKPKLGKHFVPKLFLSLVFLAAGIVNFVYSIGSVRSTINLCSKYDKCVVKSYQWNFGEEHCTCLVFADRQVKPTTYAEWIDPVDTTTNLAQLSIAGELRIVQIINRAVPELPEELRECHELEQLILAYTKTKSLPEWISEFSHLQYM